ncbi:MAG: deaminase [Patescibacteria group bacterium]|nr:deaminase [Patescibacteria group bacterium]
MSKPKKAKSARLTWDEMFMNLAVIASKRTACKFHETAAVIVDKNHRIISIGYNGPTARDVHCLDVGCAKIDGDSKTGKLKRCRGAHAEINAIINAFDGIRLRGAIIYTVLTPCYDCMKALNNCGVKELIYLKNYHRIQTGGEKVEDENESDELAAVAGIAVRQYTGEIYSKFPDEYNIIDGDKESCAMGCAS